MQMPVSNGLIKSLLLICVFICNAMIFSQETAALKAPASVQAGSKFQIHWTGPGDKLDFITMVETGAPENTYKDYVYTKRGNPLEFEAPDDAGSYELRYLKGQGYDTLGRLAITVTAASASLSAPASVSAGAEFEISWEGPNNFRDFLTIVEKGTPEKQYGAYEYTRRGTPLKMTAPDAPGEYEIRYATGRTYKSLASIPLIVMGTDATLEAPAEAVAGSIIEVHWTGPDNKLDYLTIVEPDAAERSYSNYAYLKWGNPARLEAPEVPGDYEIRYSTGQTYKTLARRPIKILEGGKPGKLRVFFKSEAKHTLSDGAGVEVILDASGSMLKRQDGRRRIDIAKEALVNLTGQEIPAGTPFALRIFGHKEANSCRSDLEISLGALNPANAAAEINAVEAKNLAKTPIAASLGKVPSDMAGINGEIVVILMTDGEETCDGDPAAAIKQLKQAGIDVRVNIVGFAIDDFGLKETFSRWAQLGNGRYFDARNGGDLGKGLTEALKVPYEVLDKNGTVVTTGVAGGDYIEVMPGAYQVKVLSTPPQMVDVEIAPDTQRDLGID